MKLTSILLTTIASFNIYANAIDITIGDNESIKKAAKPIAKGLYDYYDGTRPGGVIGMFVSPYYWWQAGAAWTNLMSYWYHTGDDTYNDVIKQSLLYQTGQNNDYMPSNQTTTEGNDDQGFWGIAAMTAAEMNFTNPDKDQPQWLELAQAVFNTMAARWDTKHCNGGLRWQIYTWNNGYDYKNTVSNGCLLNLAARLYRYTDNKTYSEWAEKTFDWVQSVKYLQPDFTLYDGGKIGNNCSEHTQLQWTYNYGLFISACAFMYNKTEDEKWKTRASNLWDKAGVFFKNGIMYEAACQPSGKCNNDQRCFKGIFSQFLGLTAKLVPDLKDDIMEKLQSSAVAAAKTCQSGESGYTCGQNWFEGKFDDKYGLGEQQSALEVLVQVIEPEEGKADKLVPLTNSTGGTSKGNPNAGSSSSEDALKQNKITIHTKDRAGAAVLTIVVMVSLIGTGFWMLK